MIIWGAAGGGHGAIGEKAKKYRLIMMKDALGPVLPMPHAALRFKAPLAPDSISGHAVRHYLWDVARAAAVENSVRTVFDLVSGIAIPGHAGAQIIIGTYRNSKMIVMKMRNDD